MSRVTAAPDRFWRGAKSEVAGSTLSGEQCAVHEQLAFDRLEVAIRRLRAIAKQASSARGAGRRFASLS